MMHFLGVEKPDWFKKLTDTNVQPDTKSEKPMTQAGGGGSKMKPPAEVMADESAEEPKQDKAA